MQQTILYNGSKVVVSKEVADFLDEERRREQAKEKATVGTEILPISARLKL